MRVMKGFKSDIFRTEEIELADTKETVVKGGRNLFPLLPKAFEGIQQIGVIGWGSQAPAQAQNLRDTFDEIGLDVKISIGLREGSSSAAEARDCGFTEEHESLGEMFDVIKRSDFVILLISDDAQAKLYQDIFSAMKPGATLGLSHGFLLGHLDSIGDSFPKNMDIVAICPKGMGPSVRRLYEQGKEVNGAGINTSFCIHQDGSGKATDLAIGWGIAIGSPYIFETTLRSEYRSDIVGERGILLGAVHGIVESLYRRYQRKGMSPKEAFLHSSESITGKIVKIISSDGLLGVYETFKEADKRIFQEAYSASYLPAKEILQEIYDEVSSGNEIRSVIMAGKRRTKYPIGKIDGTDTWVVGEKVRACRNGGDKIPLNPFTAGVYIATMIAQCDIFIENGHPYSEIVNESIIEAVDSLCPYMHYRGIAFMVDNCSITAKTGSRKFAPRFDYILEQLAYTAVDSEKPIDKELIAAFEKHKVHSALAECCKYRPSVDISLFVDTTTKEIVIE